MNLLFSGPPASGKSRAVLAEFRAIPDSYLLVPTATMAEHLRHQMARDGFPVRPTRVGTLARFLDGWDLPEPAPHALMHILIGNALDRLRPGRFAPVREFRGLHEAMAQLFEEAPPEVLLSGQCGEDLVEIFRSLQEGLAQRGMALRQARLRLAAARIREGLPIPARQIVLDGFFTLSDPELDLVEALASRSRVVLSLPTGSGADPARRRLAAAGFQLRPLSASGRTAERSAFCSANIEREAEEIARRILHSVQTGVNSFRDIGVVLRTRDPYAPLLETTFARFGIPARFYFTTPLASHPVMAYFSALLKAILGGWEYSELNAILRMPVTGLGATPSGDRFDFSLRERLPGRGLAPFTDAPPLLEVFSGMSAWRRERLDPATWAERLKRWRALLPVPAAVDGDEAGRDEIDTWRSLPAVLNAFDQALDQTAASFASAQPVELSQFSQRLETWLALEPLRIEDRRRNVVHVMDVFEARQWELKVVFVCGLLEREFPRYHPEDPLLGDSIRRRLGLPTAAQRQTEERFLFELAASRATGETIFSYSRFNERGDETLPSFFLNSVVAKEEIPACEARVRPTPARLPAAAALQPIQDPALLRQLARAHRKLSPSGLETFLQCPFQFFANKTLRLKQRPPAPRDRLDILFQGSLIHRALAEWIAAPLLGSAIFDRIFEDECADKHIPPGYRTEAVRLELLRYFEGFVKHSPLALGWETRTEESFEFALTPELTIRGRIDRLEVGPQKQALVIDYKYSPGNKIRERVDESEAGTLVQGGLYLLAAERAFGLDPVGMLYCGLKKDVTWGGWHVSPPVLDRMGESRTSEGLRELMADASRVASDAREAIVAGNVSAKPTDRDKCRWCDYRDACRVETFAAESVIGAGS